MNALCVQGATTIFDPPRLPHFPCIWTENLDRDTFSDCRRSHLYFLREVAIANVDLNR